MLSGGDFGCGPRLPGSPVSVHLVHVFIVASRGCPLSRWSCGLIFGKASTFKVKGCLLPTSRYDSTLKLRFVDLCVLGGKG